ncbi:MAG: hypothetical protein H6708_10145 [Kofleriaceae bacterium]|nr:hypothetical protein [Kofleriaceae bacterium]
MSQPPAQDLHDFGADGIDIQTAMLRHARAHPDRATRPDHILWNGQAVRTWFDVPVPNAGRFRIEFLSEPREPAQGVDVSAEGGVIRLAGGERIQTLRTWHEERYEEVVTYPFTSKHRLLKVWNVYHWEWPRGIREEKWTGNAGFLVEQEADARWLLRCSPGPARAPDFTQLVFRFAILEG